MAGFPKSIHLVEVSRKAQPELIIDPKTASEYDGPKQAYRAVSDPTIDWEALGRAKSHPLQITILETLAERDEPMSPVALSRLLGASLGTTAHHVKVLHKAGLLEEAGTEQRRGAVEHYYRLTEGES